MTPIVTIERMPFFVGPIAPGQRPDVPETLPFSLGVEPRTGLVRQLVDANLRVALARAYRAGSMLSTPLGHGALAGGRLAEALETLTRALGGEVRGKLFLEIGCGEGDALAALKARGAEVMGIEIGPQGQRGAERHRIEILEEPFETARLGRCFDCIFSFGCVEHIEALDAFWDATRAHLKDGGTIFHSVPDFSATMMSLRKEDLAHEHINYFTTASACAMLGFEGFADGKVRPNQAGNEIFFWGRAGGAAAQAAWDGTATLADFARRFDASWSAERRFFDACAARHESVGLYAGGFVSASISGCAEHMRYYDGDTAKHGKSWLSRLPAIQAPQSLMDDPVDHLVVSPVHHFDAIARHLTRELQVPRGMTIHRGFDG